MRKTEYHPDGRPILRGPVEYPASKSKWPQITVICPACRQANHHSAPEAGAIEHRAAHCLMDCPNKKRGYYIGRQSDRPRATPDTP